MKLLLLVLVMLTSSTTWAREKKAAPSANPTSSGPSSMEGYSDGPLGPNEEEKQETRKRGESMGGAPNVGAGMGTGTGAGSRVGKPVKGNEDNEDRD